MAATLKEPCLCYNKPRRKRSGGDRQRQSLLVLLSSINTNTRKATTTTTTTFISSTTTTTTNILTPYPIFGDALSAIQIINNSPEWFRKGSGSVQAAVFRAAGKTTASERKGSLELSLCSSPSSAIESSEQRSLLIIKRHEQRIHLNNSISRVCIFPYYDYCYCVID